MNAVNANPTDRHPRSRASALSERLYQLLLHAYPCAFRQEYSAEMLLVFRDSYATAEEQGIWTVLRLWGDFSWDFVKSVCIQQTNSWLQRRQRGVLLAAKEQVPMTLQFALDIAQRTDIGRTRTSNEDNLISVVPEDQELRQTKGALFVVSDGLGGHTRGEVASELAVQKVRDYYYQNLQDDIPTALKKAIEQANTDITQASADEQTEEDGHGMGATCVAAVVQDQTLYAANVGDSRVYVLHDGQLRQVTRDHSLVAQLVERGEITPAEARTHEKRNLIYRSLGQEQVEVDLFTEPVQQGDALILCTDGLSSVLEDEDLRAIVTQYDPEESVQRLIASANDAGGPDNVTAIVVHVSAA